MERRWKTCFPLHNSSSDECNHDLFASLLLPPIFSDLWHCQHWQTGYGSNLQRWFPAVQELNEQPMVPSGHVWDRWKFMVHNTEVPCVRMSHVGVWRTHSEAIRFRSSLCTCPTYGQCWDRCSTSYSIFFDFFREKNPETMAESDVLCLKIQGTPDFFHLILESPGHL